MLSSINGCYAIRGYCYLLVTSYRSSDVQVFSGVVLRNLENLIIGSSVYLAPGVIINAIGDIHLGDEVTVGFNSVLNSGNHTIKDNSYRYGDKNILPIYIGAGAGAGAGAWIATNCSITAGSNIDLCLLIAANSCYSRGSEDFAIYCSVPAVFIRYSKKC